MGNKEEKNRIIKEAIERGFVSGAIHSGIDGEESDRFEITEPLHFAGWHLYGGEAGCIYTGGRWAKIITPARKPLFVTEDGVKMYGGEQYWFIHKRMMPCIISEFVVRDERRNDDYYRFSTRKAAEDWIASQKQKQKEADLIREAEKRGFTKYPHRWDSNAERMPCVGFEYRVNWLDGIDNIHDTGSANIIWRSDRGWATIIKSEEKPKSLKPEELVEGEIYVDTEGIQSPRIIRFMRIFDDIRIDIYSQIMSTSRYEGLTSGYRFDFLRPATLEEKQKLVKAEVNNGFFYKL